MPQLKNSSVIVKEMNRSGIGRVKIIAVRAQDHCFKLIFRELIKERLHDAQCSAAVVLPAERFYIIE